MSSRTSGDEGDFIFTRYITRNGKRIYHPTGGLFKFPKRDKKSGNDAGKGGEK